MSSEDRERDDASLPPREEARRFSHALLWGGVATAVMSLVMIALHVAGVRPFARPFPLVVTERVLGISGPWTLAVTATLAHFAYGSVAGAVFAYFDRPMTLAKGIGYGLLLWFIMQITFVPALGWGDFGFTRGPAVPVYTFFVHLSYGIAIGWLGAREERWELGRFGLTSPVQARARHPRRRMPGTRTGSARRS